MKDVFCGALASSLLVSLAGAQGAVNLALNRPCTFDPKPNYAACTDPQDARQLTDGALAPASTSMWIQKAGVGWNQTNPAIITVDLGTVKPIRGVALHVGGGSGGVTWPYTIYLYVADTPEKFREAGELRQLSEREYGAPPALVTGLEPYRTYWFRTDGLKTHGRYVAFAVSSKPYFFLDEVEVYAGDSTWLNLPVKGPTMGARAWFQHAAIRNGILRRIQSDLKDVRDQVQGAKAGPALKKALLAELTSIERDMDATPYEYAPGFRAILPLNPVHQRLFNVLARLRRAQGAAVVQVWSAGQWDPMSHLADPSSTGPARVKIDSMIGEYRSGAFNVTNSSPGPLSLDLDITGVAGSTNPDFIAVQQVAWTDTYSQGVIAAALPAAERKAGHYRIDVPSGMTRQVWLTVHPVAVPPGQYHGAIALRSATVDQRVPLDLTIWPVKFPDRPTLHFGGWDYLNETLGHSGRMSPPVREALQTMLREHFVDSVWSSAFVMPFPRYDAKGKIVSPPNTSAFDAWIAMWPDMRRYMVFLSVPVKCGPWAMGTPEFTNAVKAWATFWTDHIRARKLDPAQFNLLVFDEPQHAEDDRRILLWSKAIHEAKTAMKVWEDPHHNLATTQADPAMLNDCDILCLRAVDYQNAPEYHRYFKPFIAQPGKLEFYACEGPIGFLDPYAYHRLQPWLCWQEGATACAFWAFTDTGGGSCWNPYTSKRLGEIYCPLFLDPASSVTTGKHFEACREGIEDYEYLVMLKRAIGLAKSSGGRAEWIAQAEALLAQRPAQVLNRAASKTFYWREPVDRTIADETRLSILELLSKQN